MYTFRISTKQEVEQKPTVDEQVEESQEEEDESMTVCLILVSHYLLTSETELFVFVRLVY